MRNNADSEVLNSEADGTFDCGSTLSDLPIRGFWMWPARMVEVRGGWQVNERLDSGPECTIGGMNIGWLI